MTVVVKLGGASLTADLPDGDLVVVHGGGPQITAALRERGIEPVFVHGRRVTTPEVMAVVADVLATLNAEVAALVGGTGVSGADVFTARPLDPALGLVGEVVAVDTAALPPRAVVSSVARGIDGRLHNVNADTAAAALAVALGAEQAVFLTDVPGLYAAWPDPTSLVQRIAAADLAALLPRLDGGMRPKAEAALRAVAGGVRTRVGATVVTP